MESEKKIAKPIETVVKSTPEEIQTILQAAKASPPVSWEEALGEEFRLISGSED